MTAVLLTSAPKGKEAPFDIVNDRLASSSIVSSTEQLVDILMSEALNLRGKVEYVLFDMDGLMIDSEKLYTTATNAVLGRFGKEMTWEMKAGCMGKPAKEAGIHTLSFFPDIPITVDEFIAERDRVQTALWPSVPLMPGVHRLVTHLKRHNIPMAVATSSRRLYFERKTGHLQDVFNLFDGKIVCGDDNEHKMRGKPAPDIFLVAAGRLLCRNVGGLDIEPTTTQLEERGKGLVFEDALPGLQAGKRAGMSVAWVPDPNLLKLAYPVDENPDIILGSLEEFKPEEWGLPPYLI